MTIELHLSWLTVPVFGLLLMMVVSLLLMLVTFTVRLSTATELAALQVIHLHTVDVDIVEFLVEGTVSESDR